MKKPLLVFTLRLFLILATALPVGATPTANRPKVIKIGLAENFSVMTDATTNPYINHVRNAVQYIINKNKKALQKKGVAIEIVQFDHQGEKLKVLEVAEQAVNSDILAILGFYNSSEALLAGPLFSSRQLLFVTPAASADRLESVGPVIYRTCYSDQAQALALAQYAKKDLKLKTAHTISVSDCAYCQSLNDSFKKQFEKLNGQVLSEIKILSTQVLSEQQLQALKQRPSDLVFLPNYERISATVLNQLHDAGVRPQYYMAGDGWGNTGELFYKITGDRQYRAIVTSHWHPDIKTASSKEFAKNFQKQFEREPIDTTALLADGMQFLVDVVLAAPQMTRADLLKTAEQIRKFQGVIGDVQFADQRRTPSKDIPLLRYEKQKVTLEKLIRVPEPSLTQTKGSP